MQRKISKVTLLVVLLGSLLTVPAMARVLAWRITDCAKEAGKCERGVQKVATTGQVEVNGYKISVDAVLRGSVIRVTVLQINEAYGDLKATFVVSNIGVSSVEFHRKTRSGEWRREDGRPSDYQDKWVNEQVAGLQKQDPDFSFENAR